MALADTAVTKLGRGIANIATCWVEVPAQISDAGEKEGAISALTTGVLKGAVCTVGRCLAGVYDVVTFLLPVPAGYKSLIKPEYALSSSDGVYKGM